MHFTRAMDWRKQPCWPRVDMDRPRPAAPGQSIQAPEARDCGHRAVIKQEDSQELVGCGQSLPGQELAVVNPATRTVCPEGHVGEIWIRGAECGKRLLELPGW